MNKLLVVVVLTVLGAIGAISALAVSKAVSTGVAVACATATTPAHILGVDSSNIYTIPGNSTSQCTTVTYTVPTETITVTTGSTGTTTTTQNSSLGTALPAPLAQSRGTIKIGSSSQTLATLFSGLQPGDVLELHGGMYGAGNTSTAQLSVNGTSTAPITITAYPGETPVIAQLIKATGSYIRLSKLVIDRNSSPTDTRFGQGGSNPGGNVNIWLTGSHITIENSEIKNATQSGIFDGGSYNQLLNNWIHNNGTTSDDHGIYSSGDNGLIANNIVEHNADFGIQLGYNGTTNNIITNNTLVYNGVGHTWLGSGTVDFSGATGNLFVNNISAYNGEVGYKTYDNNGNTLSHDDAYANPQGATYGSFKGSAPLTSDPKFVAPTSGDYHLQSNSSMSNAGDPSYTPQYDFNGNARSTADLGAISS